MISPLAVVLPILTATLSRAADHLVVVGGPNTLAFNPPNTVAAVGDTVTFEFHEKNHTVTQSSFPSPCSPLKGADGSAIGFNSGFMFVAVGTTSGFPTYRIQVNDTGPIWGYCQQTGHCGQGMVFSVNDTPDKSFDAFKAAAIASAGGGGANSTTTSASAAWTPPPAPVISTVTATVTVSNSVYTTTYASWEGTNANPTPAAQPAVHTVVVGGTAGLVYTPPTVTAAVGDTIQFQFQVKNHTATQSSFTNPCTSLEKSTNGAKVGFDSGFMFVDPNATTFPTKEFQVSDSAPAWFYCRQTGHCPQGMVFAVNPPTTGANTFDAFKAAAQHSNQTNSTSGGSGSGSGGNSTGSGGSGTKGNGAGRAAVSVGLSVGVIGLIVVALL